MKKKIITALITISMIIIGASENEDFMTKYKSVKGAQEILGVDSVKTGFDREFIDEAKGAFENFHWQMGGDHALYYNSNLIEIVTHAEAMPMKEYKPLYKNIDDSIGKIKFETNKREMTLDEYVVDPYHRLQGLLILHKGEIVYEAYPGMDNMDRHLWMSVSKSAVGLIVAKLEEEGLIDTKETIETYVPELIGTAWEGISVIDLLNHSSGLDIEEKYETITNPESVFVRFISAIYQSENHNGEIENWKDLLYEVEVIEGEVAGEKTRYSSINTAPLILMSERVTNKKWMDLFEEKIWSKIGARNSAIVGLTAEGDAMGYGFISSTLEDLARYALLYTPSWNKVANERVVDEKTIDYMRNSGNRKAFEGSSTQYSTRDYFGEEPYYNAFHWDAIFEDGAMYKNGNMGQGIYVDYERDVVAVYYSTKLGEVKVPGFIRAAAKELADKE